MTGRRRAAPGVELEQALALLLAELAAPVAELAACAEAAGRVAAEVVTAASAHPPADRSRLDGYAVASRSLEAASAPSPAALPLGGSTGPGATPASLARGCAWRVRTGAGVPAGADAVVPDEQVEVVGGCALVRRPAVAGEGIAAAGSDLPAGTPLLGAGEVVTPGLAAVLVALGTPQVGVWRRPRVAILITGDEHVATRRDPAATPPSNAVLLAELVREAGGEVGATGVCADDEAAIAAWLAAASPCELVVMTGGTGASEGDRTRAAWARLEARQLFAGVAIRPGRSTMAARLPACPCVALPGTPGAAAVGFELLVRPALGRLLGRQASAEPRLLAVTSPIAPGRPGRRVVWGRLLLHGTEVVVEPLQPPAHGPSLALVRGDCLIDLPDAACPVTAGGRVRVIPVRAGNALA